MTFYFCCWIWGQVPSLHVISHITFFFLLELVFLFLPLLFCFLGTHFEQGISRDKSSTVASGKLTNDSVPSKDAEGGGLLLPEPSYFAIISVFLFWILVMVIVSKNWMLNCILRWKLWRRCWSRKPFWYWWCRGTFCNIESYHIFQDFFLVPVVWWRLMAKQAFSIFCNAVKFVGWLVPSQWGRNTI